MLAYVENGNLRAKAFPLTQRLDALEVLDLDDFRVFQVTLAEAEQRCDCRFPDALKAADGFAEFWPTVLRRPRTASRSSHWTRSGKQPVTPAIAAGLTDHVCGTMEELLRRFLEKEEGVSGVVDRILGAGGRHGEIHKNRNRSGDLGLLC